VRSGPGVSRAVLSGTLMSSGALRARSARVNFALPIFTLAERARLNPTRSLSHKSSLRTLRPARG